jgi:non-ribosomal peptide synthase protein (TIGR01720 family)
MTEERVGIPGPDESQVTTLLDALRRRAAHQGDQEAFTFLVDGETREESLTYAELDARARTIGAELQSRGDPGERALLLCPAGLDYVAAFFACVYSGFVAVPAYVPGLSENVGALRTIVRSSQSRCGITTQSTLPDLRRAFADTPELATLAWLIADQIPPTRASEWRQPTIAPQSLAYLVYTSGSTSVPKGVMITHRNLMSPRLDPAYYTRDGRCRIVSWAGPHSATALSVNFVLAVRKGIPVTFMAPEVFAERPSRWIAIMSRVRGTYSSAPNSAYDIVLEATPPEERRHFDLSSWQCAENGGEQVRADTIERFQSAFASAGLRPGAVISGYGLSEAAWITNTWPGTAPTILELDRARLARGIAIPIDGASGLSQTLVGQGLPHPGVELEIVDPGSCTRCASDRVGEIWTAGPHVAAGYWNAPDETRESFQAFLADTREGPYFRTGDLGFLHEGELFITGRLKEIIIIRGRNLYPASLEASLQGCHPALRGHAAAAFALEVVNQERLAIVHEVHPGLDREERKVVMSSIRQGMVIQHGVQAHTVALVAPGAIPRIGQGKIGRAECRARLLGGTLPILVVDAFESAPVRRASGRKPRTTTEQTLVRIWERELGIKGIGIDDLFADLGGDSLLSMQILLAIREAGLPISDDDLVRYGTIADLSAAIDARAAEPAPEPEPGVGSVPLTSSQTWLLTQDNCEPATAFLEAARPLDAEVLERAMQRLLFHHDALRLRCRRTEKGWRGEYVEHTPPGLVTFTDLSAVPSEEQRSCAMGEIERVKASLDVERGLMARAGLIRLGTARDLVLLVIHPAVADGLSMVILVRDLDTLFGRLERGRPAKLPPRTATITQWQKRAAALARSHVLRREAAYWRGVVSHPQSGLPVDFPNQRRGRERIVSAWLGRERLRELQRFGQSAGTSVSDAVHYALARTLIEALATETVVFEERSHGRSPIFSDVDLSRTVGALVMHFPVLLRIDATADHRVGVGTVRTQLRAIPHHGLGYEILLDFAADDLNANLHVEGESSITLNYEGDIPGNLYEGLEVFLVAREWESPDGAQERTEIRWHSHIDISASIENEDLLLWLTYHERAYREATIERLADRMIEILTQLGQGHG